MDPALICIVGHTLTCNLGIYRVSRVTENHGTASAAPAQPSALQSVYIN